MWKYDKNAFNSISPDLLCHRAGPSTLVRGRPHTTSQIDDLTITKMIFNWIVCVSNIKPAVLWAGFVVWPWPILVSFVICTQEKNITVKLDQLILCAKRESVSFHLICFQIMLWIKFCECHSEELNEVNALSIALKVLLDGERCLLAKVLHWWIEALNHCKIDLTHFSETIEWFCKKSKSSESNVWADEAC